MAVEAEVEPAESGIVVPEIEPIRFDVEDTAGFKVRHCLTDSGRRGRRPANGGSSSGLAGLGCPGAPVSVGCLGFAASGLAGGDSLLGLLADPLAQRRTPPRRPS